MYLARPDDDTIDRYAGPYERWVFSQELGRPFAFPAIATPASDYHTALLEGAQVPPDEQGFSTRLPPLWTTKGFVRSVTPFAFFEGEVAETSEAFDALQDTRVSGLLRALRDCSSRNRSAIKPRFRVNFPIDPQTWTPDYLAGQGPDTWREPSCKPAAIVAVIDDGLPFAHRAFLDSENKSRVSYCWLQSGVALETACVPFGRELVNQDIDALRAEIPQNDAEIYRRAGAVNSGVSELGNNMRRHATHGSHVMGIAAGNDPLFATEPMGDNVQIIAVQLPNTIAWDTSGFGKEMYMLSALHYIFERASRIAAHYGDPELPLVVNFSYGWSASRHDGESEMELAIQELLEARQALQPKTALCMPSGNNFTSQMHGILAEQDFHAEAQTASIGWHLQPDDLTSSYLELWFPRDFDPAGYAVSLTPPGGGDAIDAPLLEISSCSMPADDHGDPRRFVEIEMNGRNIGQLSADQHRGTRWRVMAALIPTAYTRGEGRAAPSGLWTLTVHRDAAARPLSPDQDLQIWLQRDDDPSDLKSFGRQSRLVSFSPSRETQHPLQRYSPNLGQVRGFGAINGVASSPATTRVSGYVAQTGSPCSYSAAGGLRQEVDGTITVWGQQNDVAAVADQSLVLPGIPSIGTMSGARSRLVGTSGACPSVARLMVLNAAADQPLMQGFEEMGAYVPEPGTDARLGIQAHQHLGAWRIRGFLKSG